VFDSRRDQGELRFREKLLLCDTGEEEHKTYEIEVGLDEYFGERLVKAGKRGKRVRGIEVVSTFS